MGTESSTAGQTNVNDRGLLALCDLAVNNLEAKAMGLQQGYRESSKDLKGEG